MDSEDNDSDSSFESSSKIHAILKPDKTLTHYGHKMMLDQFRKQFIERADLLPPTAVSGGSNSSSPNPDLNSLGHDSLVGAIQSVTTVAKMASNEKIIIHL